MGLFDTISSAVARRLERRLLEQALELYVDIARPTPTDPSAWSTHLKWIESTRSEIDRVEGELLELQELFPGPPTEALDLLRLRHANARVQFESDNLQELIRILSTRLAAADRTRSTPSRTPSRKGRKRKRH